MKVVTFGEVMLRFNPEGYMRILQTNKFEATLAGSEANVSVSLANYGMDTSFVTKLPTHEMGNFVVNEMRRTGVDMSDTVRGGARVGLFFLEKGASQRASKVIYDRAGSAIATASADEFDWEKILKDATWFHFTGITVALSDSMIEACLQACKKAKEKGITVSCDINYRSQLWSREKAGAVMAKLMPYVDLCINADIFGISVEHFKEGNKFNVEGYVSAAKELVHRFGFKKVAVTLRNSITADRNILGGIIYDSASDTFAVSKEYDVHIVDRVGGGDAFSGGLIYALSNGYSDKEAIEFSVAASTLKHSMEHDFNNATVDEVKSLVSGDSTGRIKR